MSLERDPEAAGESVTAYNWQDPPFNRWAFWHVGEILPTYQVARGDSQARVLPASAAGLVLPPSAAGLDLLGLPIARLDGSPGTAGEVLADTFTDAYVVLQDGDLVTEWYGPLGAPDRAHALMSVSKSVVGCVAAVLIDRGQLDADRLVASYVPELAASGYAGATVRHVLDMRSGVRFLEEYSNPRSDIRRLDEWIGWDGADASEPRGLYRFLATLAAEAPHGSRFLYRSAESDVLGWVCERAAGRPMAELISALVWAPMGAEHDARLLHDGLDTAVHDGGLCATARDVARFGQLLLDGGVVPDGTGGTRRVVPPRWLRDGWAVDADVRAAFAASPAEASFPGGWYRNQFWFRPGAYGDVLLGLGIYGQMLHVSRRTNTVCVKFSSWPQAQNPAYLEDTLRTFDAVGGMLAGRDPTRGRRLAGVVSGLSRQGDTVPPPPPNVILPARPRRGPRRRLTWRYMPAAKEAEWLLCQVQTRLAVTSTGSRRSARSSGPTSSRSTSWARPRSICSASTAGCATSSTSPTTTLGTASIPGCSRRRTARTSSSSRASRSTTTCCATPRSASTCAVAAAYRWWRWCSSTRRPRRSAGSRATT
jgi:hypothetical protein